MQEVKNASSQTTGADLPRVGIIDRCGATNAIQYGSANLHGSEGQARPLSCGFKPTSAGGEGRYVGSIRQGGARLHEEEEGEQWNDGQKDVVGQCP
jgi:hypothetical protein